MGAIPVNVAEPGLSDYRMRLVAPRRLAHDFADAIRSGDPDDAARALQELRRLNPLHRRGQLV